MTWSWPERPRRVVVTGMGAVTALGQDVASTWDGLVAGRSGVAPITLFDPSRVSVRIAAEVKDFDPSGVLDRKEMRRTDRYIQFALVTARQALVQAGLPGRLDDAMAARTGVIVGSGLGGVATLFDNVLLMGERGPDRISPFFIPMGIANVAAGQIAIATGAIGPNFATVSACATGGHALGEAWETIRRGDADMMIAGGVEAGIHEATVGGFASMKALSTRNDDPARASRPFDRGRDGFVIGEGGGALVLEALEHAEARGATPLAELVGYGATADASHITLPAPGGIGAVRAARRALEKAGLDPSEVDHVNAHATSTPEGDKAELQAIRTIFGDHAPRVAVTANKSMIGHTLGAAGAIESIVTIMALREGIVPPTINLDDPDEHAAGLDLTPNAATRRDAAGRDVQLVRVRRPEHGPGLPEVGGVSDEQQPGEPGEPEPGAGAPAEDAPMTETREHVERVPVGPGDAEVSAADVPVPVAGASAAPDPADASLLALVDKLTAILEKSDLGELEVASGGTTIILRSPSAIERPFAVAAAAADAGAVPGDAPAPGAQAAAGAASAAGATPAAPAAAPAKPSVKAPLTGIFYGAPSPGATAYVAVGDHVAVGQIIGLIEAMKLFNEIKSDLAGRVVRVCADNGALVKAKQPLIEVEPA